MSVLRSSGRVQQQRPFALLAACAALTLGSCVSYRAAPVHPGEALRSPSPGPGPLGFEDAVRWSVDHNPELRALRSRVGAVGVPLGEPIEVGAGANEDGRANVGLAVDLAEAFAVEGALAALRDPDSKVDASAYVQAGLESGAAETAASATRAEWAAEAAAREAERTSNRSAVARLLGIGEGASPTLRLPDPQWPAVPEPTPAALIAGRADIQRLVAAFEVADAELRRAVAGQYPGLLLEPQVAFDPTALFGAVRLRIPVGASAQVRTAECAREAARADAEAGVLAALDEARRARARHRSALATLAAARTRVDASGQILRATRTRLEVSSGSVIETVFAADAVVAGARSLREASIEEARTRVRAAAAAGWPGTSGP
jgi:hypothetical protein